MLRLVNINARSIKNKTELLEVLLMHHDPHITVVTETWLHSEVSDEDVFPSAYTVFRGDRVTRGRGVAVLIRDQIAAV